MADALDMSLEDLITKNKPSHSRGRGRRNPASASGGPAQPRRRFHSRAATRSAAAPYHQLNFQQQVPPAFGYVAQPMAMVTAPSAGLDTPTKLYISNLDYNVSNEDIKDLFSEMGEIKRYSINYDKSGRSKGTADVVFSTKAEALAALKKYNNVHLDGKPMKIEVIGTNIEAPAPTIFAFGPPPPPLGNFSFPSKSGPGRAVDGRGWPRGGGGFTGRGRGRDGGRGRGASRGRGKGGRGSVVEVSAADLDADLDKYHSAAMQIS